MRGVGLDGEVPAFEAECERLADEVSEPVRGFTRWRASGCRGDSAPYEGLHSLPGRAK